MLKQKEKLTSTSVAVENLSLRQVLEMYALFCHYYDNVEQDTFMSDMNKKERVFVLTEKTSGKVVGFSTLTKVNLTLNGKSAIGLFSGDTVLDKKHWGSRALQVGMFKYMLLLKLTNPLTSIYWLLISKGYKTYLLLANNFPNYYPRFDANESDKMKQKCIGLHSVVTQYCEQLFPKAFDKEKMVLDFGSTYQRLRENIAEITPEMRAQSPKIDFFERSNPNWRNGVELPCVSEVSFHMLGAYIVKMLTKFRSSNKSNRIEPTTSAENGTIKEPFAQPKQV